MRPEEYKIPKEKFALVNENKKLHDKELVTKPIGFFKDAMHRFAKNKGSIVGAIVIGMLVLYALIAPIFSPYTVSYRDSYYARTLPKLFNSEKIDFLDGAKKQTGNVATLIKYYSMGLETGHNAIKRQEYKYFKDTESYEYRLDSYQSVGTVFMSSVTDSEYEALQDYQDRTGIQVIYPITDPTKRPAAEVNSSNNADANFWYVTKPVGSNHVPDQYKINPDGTIELTNIYAAYSNPVMDSSSGDANAAYLTVETKDAGFALKVSKDVTEKDENGEDITVRQSLGYISASYDDGINATTLVATIENASSFIYDETYSTFKVWIAEHQDASKDGYYFFALNAQRNTIVELLKDTELGNDKYIPFSLYKDKKMVTTQPEVGVDYNFAANRHTTTTTKFAVMTYLTSYQLSDNYAMAGNYIFEAAEGGYTIKCGSNYLYAKVLGDTTILDATQDATQATVFAFNPLDGALSVELTGHDDPSYDGKYYISLRNAITDPKKASVAMLREEDKGEDDHFLYVATKAGEKVTSITSGEGYILTNTVTKIHNNFYYVNGTFKGDNYHSKMRIEGEGNYVYSYAIQKAGGTYEIRVNYYEYYHYYHTEILHDKISTPYFLFGTNAAGQDIFTCLASGARFSFALAIAVAVVNMVVGAIYGAIEGYYGGKVDMIMERIVEILSAVPFMIVITLLKYHMESSSQVLILFIAFFLTGWIGESGTVRMQFYRFKNQEYVLASRTLGASDLRIMFKHIFPNALGTIITSSVLVIPGMIFSETSLSYLGIINLNSGNMTSVGTLLAAGQPYLVSYPHMILFPSIFISLLMLCFNLFGNGLRDAFNPSLRGTED